MGVAVVGTVVSELVVGPTVVGLVVVVVVVAKVVGGTVVGLAVADVVVAVAVVVVAARCVQISYLSSLLSTMQSRPALVEPLTIPRQWRLHDGLSTAHDESEQPWWLHTAYGKPKPEKKQVSSGQMPLVHQP